MTTFEEDDKQNAARKLSTEVDRVIDALKEKITENTRYLTQKGSLSQRQHYADAIKIYKNELAVLENAKNKNQFNTPDVKSILQQHTNTHNPEPKTKPQPMSPSKSFSLLGAFNNMKQVFQGWQKTALDETVNNRLQIAQNKLDILSKKLNNLSKNILTPTTAHETKVNEEKIQISEQIKGVKDDIKKLSNYKNENKVEINKICSKYTPEEQITPKENKSIHQTHNQNHTLDQILDIGIKGAQAELERLLAQHKHLKESKTKMYDPTGKTNKEMDKKIDKISKQTALVVSDIEKLSIYKAENETGNQVKNEAEINKICSKYTLKQQTIHKENKNVRQTNNQNHTLDQMLDIGIKGARAELDRLLAQCKHLNESKTKMHDPSGIISEEIDQRVTDISKKMTLIESDIEKLSIYKNENKTGNEAEISKICIKYNHHEEPAPQASERLGLK